MFLDPKTVGMSVEEYRAHIEVIDNASEIKRCLVNLDAPGIRRVWAKVSPHLPQPENDYEALYAIHLARRELKDLSPEAKKYSEHWLREHLPASKVVAAVGIIVKPLKSTDRERALVVRAAMSEAVLECVKAGMDLELDAAEVRRRMKIAKDKA